VPTLVHLDAQPEPDPASDVEPMYNVAPEMGQFTVWHDSRTQLR